MTIKELYQLAVANGAENYELMVEDEVGSVWSGIVIGDIGIVEEAQELYIFLVDSEENDD